MKKLLVGILLLKSGLISAQDTLTSFYNESWKITLPQLATYYSVAIKHDTLWRGYFFYISNDKLYSEGYYHDNSLKNATGPFQSFDSAGHRISQGYFHQGKKSGIWKYWYTDGRLSDSIFYLNNIIKFERSYHRDGSVAEMIDTDSSGKTFLRSFWSDGKPKMEGELSGGKKHGLWKIYVPEEGIVQEVNFIRDSAASVNCKSNDGKPVKECVYEKDAEMKGGLKAWQNYLVAALTNHIKEFKLGPCEGKVVVQFIVDKDGKVIEPRVVSSTNSALNDVAILIIKRSPRWIPAIQYNRKVKAYRHQPLTFKCSD